MPGCWDAFIQAPALSPAFLRAPSCPSWIPYPIGIHLRSSAKSADDLPSNGRGAEESGERRAKLTAMARPVIPPPQTKLERSASGTPRFAALHSRNFALLWGGLIV